MIQAFFKLNIAIAILGLSLLCLSQANAAEKYQSCNDTEITSLIQKFKLNINHDSSLNTSSDNDSNIPNVALQYTDDPFLSCLKLKDQNYIFAVSHPTSDQEGVLNYDLNIYAIQNDMITTSYYNAKFTVSDAFEFKGLKLETPLYSTLKNKTVIGLQTRYAHQGGINPYKEFSTLFELHKTHKFHRILDELPTYEAENIQSCIDQDSEIKRLFILDNKSAYGLQNIKLKETKTRIKFQPDSCEMRPTDTSRSHILKYDGQQYHFDREKFFSLNDPNQEE